MPWLRLWIDILDDVDLHELPDSTCWGWILMLAAAKKHNKNGALPALKILCHWLHESKYKVESWIDELVTAGLLERNDSNGVTVLVHGWCKWQEPVDKTNASRQARFRAKNKSRVEQNERNFTMENAASHACAPAPAPAPAELDSESDSDSDTPPTPPPLRNRYVTSRNTVTAPLLERECVCVQVDPASPQESNTKTEDDPEVTRVANLAAELTGDISWSLWVSQRVTLGDPIAWIESAIREMVDAGIIQRKYVGGILKRYTQDGGPKHCCSSNGRPKRKDSQTNMPYSALNLPPDIAKYDTQEYRELKAKDEAQRREREKAKRERSEQRRERKS